MVKRSSAGRPPGVRDSDPTSKDGVARAHSKNGNLLDDGTRLLNYDYKNRLISIADKASGNPVAQYFYYSDNRRARKVVFGQADVATDFFYDGWQVCEERSSATGTTTWVYNPVYIDEPVQMVTSAGAFFLHQNARADVCAVTDSAGAVVERRFYDDFGRAFDGAKQPVAGSSVGNPYGFQGRRLDPETGLFYFRARYYDPYAGRFLQRDPVWDAVQLGDQVDG